MKIAVIAGTRREFKQWRRDQPAGHGLTITEYYHVKCMDDALSVRFDEVRLIGSFTTHAKYIELYEYLMRRCNYKGRIEKS